MVVTALVLSSGPASAAEPATLWQRCPQGSGAGQCAGLGGIAVAPSGDLYVVDRGNRRINVFSPWGEFRMGWGWGVRDGGAVAQTCGPQAIPPSATCQRGVPGIGPGQLAGAVEANPASVTPGNAKGIAVDSTGAVYLYESRSCTGGVLCDPAVGEANRVQKFSSDGAFVLMFGKEVNRTKVELRETQEANAEPVTVTSQEENVCTASSGDVCGGGKLGDGPGEFGTGPINAIDPNGSFIAVASDDTIWVGGQERLQVFSSGGQYLRSVAVPGEGIRSLALDPTGNAFVAFSQPGISSVASKNDVVKLSSIGAEICTASVTDPRALATDAAGRLYVAAGESFSPSEVTLHRFNPNCVEDLTYRFAVAGLGVADQTIGIASSSACGIVGNLYYANFPGRVENGTSFLRAYYPAPDPSLCPPPAVPPAIESQYIQSVASTSAVVRAEINPRFWPDTSYYVQWGTGDCKLEPSKCDKVRLYPGAPLAGEADAPVRTGPVTLEGLMPGTAYYFRFVAQSGGGTTFGVGPAEAGTSFTTYPQSLPRKTDCPNQAFRGGPSASLPDCRAYEMVSPVDKGGGDIRPLTGDAGTLAGLDQAADSGQRFTYSSFRAFGESQSAPFTSQYLATRTGEGWATAAINPPQSGPRMLENEILASNYKGFDAELCSAWFLQQFEPTLAANAIAGYANVYQRRNCGGEVFEPITIGAPTQEPSPGVVVPLPQKRFVPNFQGASADGGHSLVRVSGRLDSVAPACTTTGTTCPSDLYDYHDGQLKFVCVLPNGLPLKGGCSAGAGHEAAFKFSYNSVYHAISDDGRTIFWTNAEVGRGRLFARLGGTKTVLISSPDSWFWGAAADGSRVLFNVPVVAAELRGNLILHEMDGGADTTIAGEVLGVMGQSEDARRVYFASREAIAGSGTNGLGASATAGQPNLYLFDATAGSYDFVATLAQGDIENIESAIHSVPRNRTSRVSGNGQFAAFTSVAPLTGADNIDAVSGEPDAEVFLYEADTGELRCVSCNAGGARPRGRQTELSDSQVGPWRAAWLPGWTTQTHPSKALADDGSRVFFNSLTPLVLADTNGRVDVYEWRQGESRSACEAQGAELHLAKEGGCISLISSGQSDANSEFVDAAAGGADVFLRTGSSLVSQDPGLLDIYDAREGGGFPPPPTPAPSCQGEACQPPPVLPSDPTPSSQTFHGDGNVKPSKKHRCPKGKAWRKGRCVKKGKKAGGKQAGKSSGGKGKRGVAR